MPEIEITNSQHERLERIKDDIEDAFIDTYGRAELEDVIAYLLDTYTPPRERDGPTVDAYERIATAGYTELQQIAADVPDVPGSGIDADEMRGKLLRELGPEELASRLQSDASEASQDGDAAAATRDGDTDETAEADVADTAPPDGPSSEAEGSSSDSETETGNGTTESDGLLSTANRLLDEHDDKWNENDDGENPYVVHLPDGTSETVRTKDDIRRLLFQHY